MNSLSIEQYPSIAPPQVMVTTTYTGADANTIMKSVIQPLEESINGVPGMTYMTSKAASSGMSIGTIALLFVVPAFFIVFQKLHERFQGSEVKVNSEK